MLRKFSPLLLLFLLIVPTFNTLSRPGYFPMHDDMQAMRLLQLDKCVKDGQIPCRWVPDMGYGYGYPQFNYYAPLPYYLMEGVHLMGYSFLDSVKIGFALSVVVSAFGMYLFGSMLWGRAGGIVSAILYSYAPYRAVDMYVRGAVGEFYALAFLPLVFWSVKKVIDGEKRATLWMALSFSGLFMSHNITTLMSVPFIAAWTILLLYPSLKDKKALFNKIKGLIFSGIWALFISAFFLLPAWYEKSLVHVETLLQGYFNYLAHYVSLDQLLLSNYWNYGTSEAHAYDNMSFAVGITLWLLPLISLLLIAILKKRKYTNYVLFLVIAGWASLFMIHSKSTFIWNSVSILKYLQFPWRFLTFATLMFAAASGSLTILFNKYSQKVYLIIFIIVSSIFLYGGFFAPSKWLDINDSDKFSGESWERQLTISIFDYLPISAEFPPFEKAPDEPQFLEGEGAVINGNKGTDWQNWQLEVFSEKATLQLSLYYFPNWTVWVDGNEKEIRYDNSLGLITFDLENGEHDVEAKLSDTDTRFYANIYSLIGITAIPVYLIVKRRNEEK
jgi:uncharacterized membrane protein